MDTREQQFLENWLSLLITKIKNKAFISAEKYRPNRPCEKARSKDGKKSVEEYNASKQLDELSIADVENLVKKRKTEDEPILYFIPNEELYSKIQEIHVQEGHGAIACTTCSKLIHAECSLVQECHPCGLAASQRVKRKAVEQVQEKQAKKMEDSQARLEPLQVGNDVTIPIS